MDSKELEFNKAYWELINSDEVKKLIREKSKQYRLISQNRR